MIHRPTSVRSLKARSPFTALTLVIANKVPTDTPIPDTLRLWRLGRNDYILRSNTLMTLDSKTISLRVSNDQVAADTCLDLQNILTDFQERYGRTTTMNHFLHSEYNGLSDKQLKRILGLWFQKCGTSQQFSCWYARSRPCQCLAIYRASGQLPSPSWNTV